MILSSSKCSMAADSSEYVLASSTSQPVWQAIQQSRVASILIKGGNSADPFWSIQLSSHCVILCHIVSGTWNHWPHSFPPFPSPSLPTYLHGLHRQKVYSEILSRLFAGYKQSIYNWQFSRITIYKNKKRQLQMRGGKHFWIIQHNIELPKKGLNAFKDK